MDRSRTCGIFAVLFVALFLFLPAFSQPLGYQEAVVYFNEACQHCVQYIDGELEPVLDGLGINVTRKDYINNRENRVELNELNEELGWCQNPGDPIIL